MKAVIYILRSGLKHYRPPQENERVFYWDPRSKILYPKSQNLQGFEQYVLVDSNITTGKTVRRVIEQLGLPSEKVKIRGNPKTEIAKKIIDELVPDGNPQWDKVIIAFSGKPASLKSFLARGLGMVQRIPVIQIGKELQRLTDVGEYGEKLAKKEQENPFIVGELLYPILQQYKNKRIIIIDGIKTRETALFLSYTSRRPIFIFYVQINEQIRREALMLRGDKDDQYWREREALFEPGLTRLKEEAYAVIDIDDWRTLRPLCELMELLGYKTSRILDIPNPFGSKIPILELYRRNVEKLAAEKTMINRDFSELLFHRSYIERLEKHGIYLDQKRAKIVMLTATAFRIVDDILDEHVIRNKQPAFWRVHGITKSIFVATLMTVKAWSLAQSLGLGERFLRMFRRVIGAVKYELEVEDGIAKFETFNDWLRAAEREAAFREFLAYLAGMPEKASEFRAWALRAQAKDDLLGARKGGREDTERRLKRPLFKRQWQQHLLPS